MPPEAGDVGFGVLRDPMNARTGGRCLSVGDDAEWVYPLLRE
jgi:hypothetical protein